MIGASAQRYEQLHGLCSGQDHLREQGSIRGHRRKKYEQFAVEMGKHVDYLLVIDRLEGDPAENRIAGLQDVS